MPRNVEVKVRVDSLARLRAALVRLGARGPQRLRQTDTYYRTAHGRLKLRAAMASGRRRVELIGYARPDRAIRTSRYEIVPVEPGAARALHAALAQTLGVRVVVHKTRELWMAGSDRVHLDRVRGLGAFLEIEALVGAPLTAGGRGRGPGYRGRQGGSEAAGRRRTLALLRALDLGRAPCVAGSYADLLSPSKRR